MLDVTGRTIAIIGGGAVAARKARGLIDAGAKQVRCVAPEFCVEMPAEVRRIAAPYRPEHLDGAVLVFAATDRPDVNDQVVRDAHARGLLVSRADNDEQEPGDFVTPARLQRGRVIVSVAAQSAALSAMIRDRVAQVFDPAWRAIADAMEELRPLIKASAVSIEARRHIFRELTTDEALDVMRRDGTAGLRRWLLDRHPELTHA